MFFEYVSIKEVFKYLRHNVELVSKNTVRCDVKKKYIYLKEKIKLLLGSSRNKISLISVLWNSLTTNGYIFFINDD